MSRMKDFSIAALIAGAAVATTSGVVLASKEDGQQYREGRSTEAPTVSMQGVIANLKGSGAQRILESEYEREDGRAVYEVKYVDAEGRTHEVYIDATDGKRFKDEHEE